MHLVLVVGRCSVTTDCHWSIWLYEAITEEWWHSSIFHCKKVWSEEIKKCTFLVCLYVVWRDVISFFSQLNSCQICNINKKFVHILLLKQSFLFVMERAIVLESENRGLIPRTSLPTQFSKSLSEPSSSSSQNRNNYLLPDYFTGIL